MAHTPSVLVSSSAKRSKDNYLAQPEQVKINDFMSPKTESSNSSLKSKTVPKTDRRVYTSTKKIPSQPLIDQYALIFTSSESTTQVTKPHNALLVPHESVNNPKALIENRNNCSNLTPDMIASVQKKLKKDIGALGAPDWKRPPKFDPSAARAVTEQNPDLKVGPLGPAWTNTLVREKSQRTLLRSENAVLVCR